MKRKILNYFEIAARIAKSKDDRRSFLLGCVAIRNDGCMVKSLNSPTETKNRQAHAEYKICKKIDSSAVIYVARVRLDNFFFAIARPCDACMKRLQFMRVCRCFYTVDQTHYGVINFDRGTENIHVMNARD
jgi:tRNA(Arg) A34 adenosine deaminase TadA